MSYKAQKGKFTLPENKIFQPAQTEIKSELAEMIQSK